MVAVFVGGPCGGKYLQLRYPTWQVEFPLMSLDRPHPGRAYYRMRWTQNLQELPLVYDYVGTEWPTFECCEDA